MKWEKARQRMWVWGGFVREGDNEWIEFPFLCTTELLFDVFPMSMYLFFNEKPKKQLSHLETYKRLLHKLTINNCLYF